MTNYFLNLQPKSGLRRPLKLILLIFFMGYIAFIPTGPYPVILWGIKLDHLFAFGTALLSFVLFRYKWPRGLRPVYISVVLFISVTFITMASSSDLDTSLRGFIVSLGYAIIALLTPVLIYDRVIILRWYLFSVATLTGFFVLYLFFFVHDTGRLQIYSTVDPNMTSVGLLMSLIIFLPEYFKRKTFFLARVFTTFLFIFSIAIVLAAIICLLSRTALFSFVFAFVWGMFFVMFKNKNLFYRQIILKTGLVTIAVFLGIVCINVAKPDIVFSYSHRITRIFQGNLGLPESGRLIRADNLLDKWCENPKTFILGEGYFTINPHNEFLRMLGGSGLFGFISFVLMFLAFYLVCCRSRSASALYLFCQNVLFVYILIMVQFYGHTKSLWVGFTFLSLNYITEKGRKRRIQIRRPHQITTVASWARIG